MQKSNASPSDAVQRLENLYTANTYVSYSALAAISYSPVSFWAQIGLFFKDYSAFRIKAASRKVFKTYNNEAARKKHNDAIIIAAQQQAFEIEGQYLDTQQIEAVVVNEDAQLVMAAAGSGKTLSLLAKCKYLVEELHIPAKRILTVSFTNSSAHELAERLKTMGIEVDGKTFHALGNSILSRSGAKAIDQAAQQKLLTTIINEKFKTDETFARRYNDYLLHYFTMPSLPIEAQSLEHLVAANRSFNTITLKEVSLDKKDYSAAHTTYRGEKVRSKEEQIIANFLYINNIPYDYEKPFPGYASYKPDFTITQFSEPIYLEHQGIDRRGNTRKDIDSTYYRRKMKWNRQYHQDGGTRLVETYSYEFSEGTILQNLEARLKSQGVEIVRRQESEILKLIKHSYSYDVTKLNELFITYVGLLKTSELTLEDVRKNIQQSSSLHQVRRSAAFLSLFETIFTQYETALQAQGSIDFSDMIVKASSLLPIMPPGLFQYDYILVDEVQDLSGARYRLLKALLDRVPSSKLFAVGDDWQSIFRFAGSDLTLLKDFEMRFERHTYFSSIEQTHRFNNPLLDATSAFISKNPAQLPKQPYSTSIEPTLLKVNTSADRDSDATALGDELQTLVDTYGAQTIAERSIFIISRYKRDRLRLENTADPRMQFTPLDEAGAYIKWTDTRTGLALKIPFMTMHAAKGRTCDFAFILNGNGGFMGIPSERDDDPVLSMLLTHPDSFKNAEERRLFYVSLTRARIATTIIACAHNPSPFIDELNLPLDAFSSTSATLQERCPACHSGRLIKRTGPHGDFFGCSNFGYGCTYSTGSPQYL